MKNLLPIFTAAIAVLAVSCSGLEDNGDRPNEPIEDPVTAYEIGFYVSLGQAWYDCFDVNVSYTDENGVQQNLTINENSKYEGRFTADRLADSYTYTIVAEPKDPATVNGNPPFVLDRDVTCTIYSITESGEKTLSATRNSSSTLTAQTEEQMNGYISESHQIFSVTWTREELTGESAE